MAERALVPEQSATKPELAWINLAKGLSIIMVVMMHSALGVEREIGQAGWLHVIVAWTKPFRMPDFFLLSGFLASSVVSLDWRGFLDRKMLYYAYFYFLWFTIVLVIKAGALGLSTPGAFLSEWLLGIVEPFSTLWFIYILPFFLLGARLAAGRFRAVFVVGAILLHLAAVAYPEGGAYAMASQMSSSTALNSFSLFFVFFLTGFLGRSHLIVLVEATLRHPIMAAGALLCWATAHSYALHLGITAIPGLTLVFGIVGAIAVIVFAALLSHAKFVAWLAYCGRHSLAIYLAFVIPMAATRSALIAAGFISQPGTTAFVVFVAAVTLPLVLERFVMATPLRFLFVRPRWVRLRETERTA